MTALESSLRARTAVVNCVCAPIELFDWIVQSFADTFATLNQVPGVREFRLRRLTLVGTQQLCVLISVTLWDELRQFESWRTSEAFRLAHPARERFAAEFELMRSIRLDIAVAPGSGLDDLDAVVLARLREEHPELAPEGCRIVGEIRWSARDATAPGSSAEHAS